MGHQNITRKKIKLILKKNQNRSNQAKRSNSLVENERGKKYAKMLTHNNI